MARPRLPKCRHCGKAIRACMAACPPLVPCPELSHGWRHHGTRKHRCGPQAGTTYAQPEGDGDG